MQHTSMNMISNRDACLRSALYALQHVFLKSLKLCESLYLAPPMTVESIIHQRDQQFVHKPHLTTASDPGLIRASVAAHNSSTYRKPSPESTRREHALG